MILVAYARAYKVTPDGNPVRFKTVEFEPVVEIILVFSMVGLIVVLQQIPFSMMVVPPVDLIVKPLKAVVYEIIVTAEVVTTGKFLEILSLNVRLSTIETGILVTVLLVVWISNRVSLLLNLRLSTELTMTWMTDKSALNILSVFWANKVTIKITLKITSPYFFIVS